MHVGIIHDSGDQVNINTTNVYYQHAYGEFDDWFHISSYLITCQREILQLSTNDSIQYKALHSTRVEPELRNACPVLEWTLSRRSRNGQRGKRELWMSLYAGLMPLRDLESQQLRGLSQNGAQSREYLDRVISFSVDQEIEAKFPALCQHLPIISHNLFRPLNPSLRSSSREEPLSSVDQPHISSGNYSLILFVAPI